MTEYEIVGWAELQHYSKRKPPWIKFYRSLLTSYRFTQLPDVSKAHYCCLLLVASDTDGRFVGDADFLARTIHATEPINVDKLVSAGLVRECGVLALDASISRDRDREEKSREETETVPKGTALDDVEKWNERLAPLARALGGEQQTGNWLKYWKPICTTVHKVDEAEEIMWGLRWLIDKGQLEETHGLRKGGTCKPSILRSPRADILVRNCHEAHGRHAPNEGVELVRQLTQGGI